MNTDVLDCPLLVSSGDADPDSLAGLLREFPGLHLGQAWQERTAVDFAGGTVRAARDADSLIVFAELTDVDIRTSAARPNTPLWILGDTFEIFLRPPGSEAYWELHIAPNNLRLRLRFPHAAAAREHGKTLPPGANPAELIRPFVLEEDFMSEVWTSGRTPGWSVLVRLPFSLFGRNAPGPGETWPASFCRYDYTGGREHPVISSTSPHRRPDFHDQRDWGSLRFVNQPPANAAIPAAE